jgi:hypothetical protein
MQLCFGYFLEHCWHFACQGLSQQQGGHQVRRCFISMVEGGSYTTNSVMHELHLSTVKRSKVPVPN